MEAERLDRPPPRDRYLRLPESFGRRFMTFVDTEEEFDWGKPHNRANRATTHVKSMAAAHDRLQALGALPIYLVDHPIATDPRAVEILGSLRERGLCEIGTHLHPWVNPPYEEVVSPANSFAGNLPRELERAKLADITDTIEQAFGVRPIVYRAGRYGVGPNSAAILEELGYRLDVSVRAMFDYSDEKGPDFSGIEPLPYFLANGMVELPLSAAYLGGLRGFGPKLFPLSGKAPLLRGALARARLLNRVPITPEGTPLAEALEAVEQLLDDDLQLISISYHSPSIEPGHTPFVRSEADLRDFYAWWEGVLGLLAKRGVTAASTAELLAAAGQARPLHA
jgi:hypothetical protein